MELDRVVSRGCISARFPHECQAAWYAWPGHQIHEERSRGAGGIEDEEAESGDRVVFCDIIVQADRQVAVKSQSLSSVMFI